MARVNVFLGLIVVTLPIVMPIANYVGSLNHVVVGGGVVLLAGYDELTAYEPSRISLLADIATIGLGSWLVIASMLFQVRSNLIIWMDMLVGTLIIGVSGYTAVWTLNNLMASGQTA